MSEHFGPLGETVFERTYARDTDHGLESWSEVIDRVVRGNSELGPLPPGRGEQAQLRAHLLDMRLQPAGRHLWATGARTSLGLFNCFRAGWGDGPADHFTFMFDQLMLGGGVGSNYSSEYLSKVAVFSSVELRPILSSRHRDYPHEKPVFTSWAAAGVSDAHMVEDSREGWVEALRLLIEAHADPSIAGHTLALDFSNVRPSGDPIRGFGGTASGPVPLIEMLVKVNALLNQVINDRGDFWHGATLEAVTLTPLEAMEIDHLIASCVVAGNVRRSARMSIIHWADDYALGFINAKDDPTMHWSTNISIEIDNEFISLVRATRNPFDSRSVKAHMVFTLATERMYEHGEPGFYNSSLASEGERGDVRSTNPCGEIALEDWEACNLGHINLGKFRPDEDAEMHFAARLMARFLYRATFAPVSDPRIAEVENRNHRIGVGLLGLQEWAANHGVAYADIADSALILGKLALLEKVVTAEVNAYADSMGKPRPIKTTTVAPTGTISQLSGNTPGIQPIFARHFIRRIRFSTVAIDEKGREKREKAEAQKNFVGAEKDLYSANTDVLSFLAEDAILTKVDNPNLIQDQSELSFKEMIRVQSAIQHAWANNAISFTANFDPEKLSLNDLRAVLVEHLDKVKGTTIFPDLSRPQSPIERISSAEYELEMFLADQGVDENCATGACPIK